MKISNNFYLKEFLKEKKDITPTQIYMLSNLCNNILEPIRNILGCPIKITSGIRFPSDINRLRKAGYNPSETSDHLFGNIVRIKSIIKRQRFGGYYGYSTGACDIQPTCGAYDAWCILKRYFDVKNSCIHLPEIHQGSTIIKIKQFILEQNKDTYWIHVSNPANIIYSDTFIKKYLIKYPFLISKNNGRSYETYKP